MEMESFVMRRILGIEKKNRVKVSTMIEKELIETIRKNGLDLANSINLALEEFLRKKNLLPRN